MRGDEVSSVRETPTVAIKEEEKKKKKTVLKEARKRTRQSHT